MQRLPGQWYFYAHFRAVSACSSRGLFDRQHTECVKEVRDNDEQQGDQVKGRRSPAPGLQGRDTGDSPQRSDSWAHGGKAAELSRKRHCRGPGADEPGGEEKALQCFGQRSSLRHFGVFRFEKGISLRAGYKKAHRHSGPYGRPVGGRLSPGAGPCGEKRPVGADGRRAAPGAAAAQLL